MLTIFLRCGMLNMLGRLWPSLSFCSKRQKKWPLTVCSFSELLSQSRVISLHSYYLTSLVNLSFCRLDICLFHFLFWSYFSRIFNFMRILGRMKSSDRKCNTLILIFLCDKVPSEFLILLFVLILFGYDCLACPSDFWCGSLFSDP